MQYKISARNSVTKQAEIEINGLTVREHLARKIEGTVIPENSPEVTMLKINPTDYLLVAFMPRSINDMVGAAFIRGISNVLRMVPTSINSDIQRNLYHIYIFPDEINFGSLIKDTKTIMQWKTLYQDLNFNPLNLVVTKDDGNWLASVIKSFVSTVTQNNFVFKRYDRSLMKDIAEGIRKGNLSYMFIP